MNLRILSPPDRKIQNVFYAIPMHNKGKVGIPDKIQPGNLK